MKNKIKIEKEEKYYLFIILIGIVLTFFISIVNWRKEK